MNLYSEYVNHITHHNPITNEGCEACQLYRDGNIAFDFTAPEGGK